MKKKMSYSIRYQGDEMIAVGVSRLETDRWRIENLETNAIDAGPSDSLAKDIIKNKETFTMVASGEDVHTALIKLPHLKKKQMNLAANGWVAREESTPAGQWIVNWNQRENSEDAPKQDALDVFLLYATKEFVADQIAKPKSWNGEPSQLMPDFMALEALYRDFGPDHDDLEGWNIVFVSKDDHFLCVSTPAGLIMNRALPGDLSDGSDGEEYLQRLATEVDRSIFFARQTEFNPNVERVIVCGDPTMAQGLVAHLQEETSVPAMYWNIADMFDLDGAELSSNLFLPAVAAIMAGQKCNCNLLPKKARVLIGPVFQRRLVVAGSTAAAVVIPLLVVGGFLTTTIQDHYLEKARLKLDQARVRADEAAQVYITQRVLEARQQHIVTLNNNEQDYARVLLHLASLTPEEIIFKDLRLKEAGPGKLVLLLSGESNSDTVEVAQQSFLDFQAALNGSPLLRSMGEPRKMIIDEENTQGEKIKKVEFIMEYRVKPDQVTENEVAVVSPTLRGN